MKKMIIGILACAALIFTNFITASADQKAWDDLYEKAKKEGEIIFNPAIGDVASYNIVKKAWEKRFPGIKLRIISVGGPQVESRIITEAGAGKISMDVSRTGVENVLGLLERDLLEQFDWTGFDIPEKDIFLDGKLLYYFYFPWVIYYNHDLVSAEDAPKTWDDLLDPKWKGKMIFHRGSPNIYIMVHEWGQEKWRSYINKLSKQEAIVGMRGMNVIRKVSQGERVIGNNSVDSILREAKKGAPLTISSVSPQGFLRSDLGSFKGSPHPNAAKLFMAWSMTPEGRKAVLDTGMGFGLDSQQVLKKNNIKGITALTVEQNKLSKKMQKEWMTTMGFVPK